MGSSRQTNALMVVFFQVADHQLGEETRSEVDAGAGVCFLWGGFVGRGIWQKAFGLSGCAW